MDRRIGVHDEKEQGRHSTVTDKLGQKVHKVVAEETCFTTSDRSDKFTHISKTSAFQTVSRCRFETNKKLLDEVNNWLDTLALPLFDEEIQKFVQWNLGCNYMEK